MSALFIGTNITRSPHISSVSETGEQIGTGYPLLKRAATTHVQGSDFGQGNFPGAHAPEHLLRIQPPSSQPRPLTNADSALSPITSRVNAKPPQKRSVFLGATVNNSRSMSSRKSLNASRTPSRFSTSPVSPNFASLSAEKDLRQGQVGLPTSAQYDRELEGKYRWRDMRDSDDDDEDDRVR